MKKVYWDACAWIELIQQTDSDKFERCKYVISQLDSRHLELWTSAFTLAEVYKVKCPGGAADSLEAENDDAFDNFIEREEIVKAQVDIETGLCARKLLRAYPKIRKPQDAIHVATCILNDIDELHTFDGANLLDFDNCLRTASGKMLRIITPPLPPAPKLL